MERSEAELFTHFERYRGYLSALARTQLDGRVQAKLDPSDVVQETLMEAYRDRSKLKAETEPQKLAWLRKILAHNIANILRDFHRKKRNVSLEVRLEEGLGDSAVRLEGWLTAQQDSPSKEAMKVERLLELSTVLRELSEEQQHVIVLHYCQELPLEEIGRRMGKRSEAVAALAYRGIRKLRQLLQERDL